MNADRIKRDTSLFCFLLCSLKDEKKKKKQPTEKKKKKKKKSSKPDNNETNATSAVIQSKYNIQKFTLANFFA
jgi:hypothetical protein